MTDYKYLYGFIGWQCKYKIRWGPSKDDVVSNRKVTQKKVSTSTPFTEKGDKGSEGRGQKLLPIFRQRRLWIDPMKKDFISDILAFTSYI